MSWWQMQLLCSSCWAKDQFRSRFHEVRKGTKLAFYLQRFHWGLFPCWVFLACLEELWKLLDPGSEYSKIKKCRVPLRWCKLIFCLILHVELKQKVHSYSLSYWSIILCVFIYQISYFDVLVFFLFLDFLYILVRIPSVIIFYIYPYKQGLLPTLLFVFCFLFYFPWNKHTWKLFIPNHKNTFNHFKAPPDYKLWSRGQATLLDQLQWKTAMQKVLTFNIHKTVNSLHQSGANFTSKFCNYHIKQ